VEIISKAWTEESTTYALVFERKGDRYGGGWAFDCDAEGVPFPPKAEAGAENLRACLSGEHDVHEPYVQAYHHRYRHPRVGRCACGAEVVLSHFTNTCECGADYNMSGDRLAPRECWGEETGEHWSECY